MMKSTLIAIAVFCLASGVLADTPNSSPARMTEKIPEGGWVYGTVRHLYAELHQPFSATVENRGLTRYECVIVICRLVGEHSDQIKTNPFQGATIRDEIYALSRELGPEIKQARFEDEFDFVSAEPKPAYRKEQGFWFARHKVEKN